MVKLKKITEQKYIFSIVFMEEKGLFLERENKTAFIQHVY